MAFVHRACDNRYNSRAACSALRLLNLCSLVEQNPDPLNTKTPSCLPNKQKLEKLDPKRLLDIHRQTVSLTDVLPSCHSHLVAFSKLALLSSGTLSTAV
jgi:hypothetical protein